MFTLGKNLTNSVCGDGWRKRMIPGVHTEPTVDRKADIGPLCMR